MGRNKAVAIDFLNMVIAGKFDEAYSKYVDMKGKHHNAYTAAGFSALKQGMMENESKFPNKKFEIRHVVEEENMVATHSWVALAPGDLELGAVHWFRFEDEKIVELWDVGQQIPKDLVNRDGMF